MNNNNIEFREVKSSDYSALEKIISDTWKYETFCSPKTAKKMSKLYLASCLSNQDFTCVAVNNGEPVGVIMAKDEQNHKTKSRYILRCLFAGMAMFLSKEGRQIANVFKGFDTLDRELLKKSGKTFDGELAFFAIDSNQRGMGTGKELFHRAQGFMKAQNIKNFYLYTDSSCNYGFYEHQGMKRLNEKICSLKPYADKDLIFFLYEYVI